LFDGPFRIEPCFAPRYSYIVENDDEQHNACDKFKCAPGGPILESDGCAGSALGRGVFSRRTFDAHLLPAKLSCAAAAAAERGIFSNAARSGAEPVPAM